MIPEEEYNNRKRTLLAAGVDEREAPIKAVLDYGIGKRNITADEAAAAFSTLQTFFTDHKREGEAVFLSPRFYISVY